MKASRAWPIIIIMIAQSPVLLFAQWEYGGNVICGSDWHTYTHNSSADIDGGILVAWEDLRELFNSDIYVQKVDSAGYEIWIENGIQAAVCTSGQYDPRVVSDGTGGAIVGWSDFGRNGGNYDIYVQKVDSDGHRVWEEDGRNIIYRGGHQYLDDMVGDGFGGAILSWSDEYYGYSDTMPVVVQRINEFGDLIFGESGLNVTDLRSGIQSYSQLVRTSDSNFIVIWFDSRESDPGPGIYAQKFDLHGNLLWDSDGMPLAMAPAEPQAENTKMVPDVDGGIYCIWSNWYSSRGVSMQWVNGQGQAGWGPGGLVISEGWYHAEPQIAINSDGKAIIAWIYEPHTPKKTFLNIIDSTGTLHWQQHLLIGENTYKTLGITQSIEGEFEIGVKRSDLECKSRLIKYDIEEGFIWGDSGVCFGLPYPSGFDIKMVSDYMGGTICSWKRWEDLYVVVNRVYYDGWVAPDTTTAIDNGDEIPDGYFILRAYPNPFNSKTNIVYSASNLGPQPPQVKLQIFDIQGRVVKTLVDERKPMGTYRVVWDGTDNQGRPVSSGVYMAKLFQWGQDAGDFPVKITLMK
jgi:hypothetical protein